MIAITIKQKKPLVRIAICYMALNSMAISFKIFTASVKHCVDMIKLTYCSQA